MTANDRLRELLGLGREAGQPQLAEAAVRERFGVPDRWPFGPGLCGERGGTTSRCWSCSSGT